MVVGSAGREVGLRGGGQVGLDGSRGLAELVLVEGLNALDGILVSHGSGGGVGGC